MQLGRDQMEVEILDRLPEAGVELGQAMQHPALKLGHIGIGHLLRLRRVAVEAAQKVAQGVAQAAIGLGLVLQDLRADALVLGVVGADHPQAQDVGAVLVAHRLRRGDVAQRLRHLAALLVEREAVRQHAVVGRAAARAAALEQRGMEPAAMLVGAFEIEVGRPFELGIALEREDVRAARVEPDVEDVRHLLVILGLVLVAEEALGRAFEPHVGAFGAEGVDHAAHHLGIAQWLAGLLVDEHRDRHAPGALARHAPVRPLLDHAAQPVVAGARHETSRIDRRQRLLAQGAADVGDRLVHGDEPLRRIAEDHRRLGAPGMRIGVADAAEGQELARLVEGIADRTIGVALHALGRVDALAGE